MLSEAPPLLADAAPPPPHNTNPNAGRTEQFPVNQNSQPFPVNPNSQPFPVNQNSQPSPNYLVSPTNASPTFAENVQVPPVNRQFQVDIPSHVSTPIIPENVIREDKPKSKKGKQYQYDLIEIN